MTTIPDWVAVAVPVLAAVAGGAIGLGGSWYTSKSIVAQWRRDLKIQAYRDLSSASTEFMHATSWAYITAPESAQAAEAYGRLQGANRSADAAATFSQMVAGKDVQRPVSGLMAAGVGLFTAATANPRPSREQFDAASLDYIHWQDAFTANVQKELGFLGYVKMPGNPY